MQVCSNCQHSFAGNFCPNCGQRSDLPDFTLKAIFWEILKNLNVERGLFFTLKELSLRPGKTIAEYMAGRRVIHLNPFRYLVFMVAIGAFVNLFVDYMPATEESMNDIEAPFSAKEVSNEVERIIREYYTLISMLSIPLISVYTLLFFKRHRHNYARHLVLNTFFMAHSLWLFIIFSPLFMFENELLVLLGSILSLVANLAYIAWTYVQYFDPQKKWLAVVKSLLVWILFTLTLQLIIGSIVGYRLAAPA